MEHQINDFKKECDTQVYDNQETFTREEVKSLLWSQIAKIHNDVNEIIYSNMKAETTDKGENLREWNKEEYEIMELIKNPRCVNF